MTDRELMQQALDALEHVIYWDNEKPEWGYAHKAITALRERLAQPVQHDPVMYQFRWTNPGGQEVQDTEIEWHEVAPRRNGTVQEKCTELLAHRYGGKPCYEIRELYTSPQAAQPQPVQQDHYKELAALGWQAIECPVCGSSAQGYPRQAAQPLSDERLCEAMRKASDELLDHIYEFSTISEGVNPRLLAVGRSIEQAHGITKGTT